MWIVAIAVWLAVGTLFWTVNLPWPFTDEEHMRQCMTEHGVYKKVESKHGNGKDWTCTYQEVNR